MPALRGYIETEAKRAGMAIEVIEPVGGDWEFLTSSHRATKVDAFTFKFEVDVPPRGEETITYRVRTRWC